MPRTNSDTSYDGAIARAFSTVALPRPRLLYSEHCCSMTSLFRPQTCSSTMSLVVTTGIPTITNNNNTKCTLYHNGTVAVSSLTATFNSVGIFCSAVPADCPNEHLNERTIPVRPIARHAAAPLWTAQVLRMAALLFCKQQQTAESLNRRCPSREVAGMHIPRRSGTCARVCLHAYHTSMIVVWMQDLQQQQRDDVP